MASDSGTLMLQDADRLLREVGLILTLVDILPVQTLPGGTRELALWSRFNWCQFGKAHLPGLKTLGRAEEIVRNLVDQFAGLRSLPKLTLLLEVQGRL